MMNQPYNIFIEGIPGSGKSTLLDALARHFTDYRVFREGDISPVELAWCAYMTETEYRQALSDLADLRDEIEKLQRGEDPTADTSTRRAAEKQRKTGKGRRSYKK